MKLKLTLQTQANLFALFCAFEHFVEDAPPVEAAELQRIYNDVRREIIGHFRCEQCDQIYEAAEEFEDFICNICAHNNADRHLAEVVDLEQWINRNK